MAGARPINPNHKDRPMPIDFGPLEELMMEVRNLETDSERHLAMAAREVGSRGGADDIMWEFKEFTRLLYIFLNGLHNLHAGFVTARDGGPDAEELAPGLTEEQRAQWFEHLHQSGVEAALNSLEPRIVQLVLRAPSHYDVYPKLPKPFGSTLRKQTTSLENK